VTTLPTLAAILLHSLFLIPCYLAGAITLGVNLDWDDLGGQDGECFRESGCRDTWHILNALEIAAMVLQLVGLCVLRLTLCFYPALLTKGSM
jgi:hypothetical protein